MNESHAPIEEEEVSIDLSGLLHALKRAMRWLIPLTLVVAVCVFTLLQFVSPKYRGEARLLIEVGDAFYAGESRGAEGERALLDTEGVSSQVQLLKSRDLARRVAKRLDLAALPEFDGGGDSMISDVLVLLGLAPDPSRISPEERVLKNYFRNLAVYRVEGSRVLAIEFSSKDPELAAAVTNTIAEEYLALQKAAKRETTASAASALETQIETLRRSVQQEQQAVETFRAGADLLLADGNQTLNQQQLADLSSQLSQAVAAQSNAEATAKLIAELLKSGGSLETASEVLNSQLIQRLRERQVELQSRIAELSTTHLPSHPQMKSLQSQMDDYERQIRGEARKIMIGLENDAKVARDRVQSLREGLNELKVNAAKSNENQIKLRELEREASAKASELDALMARYREAETRRTSQFLTADARLISRATIPLEPYSPKVWAITIIVALAVFLLSMAWILLSEFLSGRALTRSPIQEKPLFEENAVFVEKSDLEVGRRGSEEIEVEEAEFDAAQTQQTDEPLDDEVASAGRSGGSVDDVARAAQALAAAAGVSLPRRTSQAKQEEPVLAEKIVTEEMSTTSNFEGLKRIAVLSVDSDEASQKVTFRLVRHAANEGILPLFLEVRPDMSDEDAAAGFSDLLDGSTSFSGVIYRDSNSRAHVIEAGRKAIDDQLMGKGRFELVIEAIDHTYDQVFFDLGLIDDSLVSAQLLAIADRVVVATGGSPAGPELERALRMLEEHTGAEVVVERTGDSNANGNERGDMAA